MSPRCPVHPDFDPLVPETFDSAHAQYAELRARCPVAHSDAFGGFWALTRYDDVVTALSDHATYVTSVQNVVPKVAFTGRRPPLHLDPPTTRRTALRSTRCSRRSVWPRSNRWCAASPPNCSTRCRQRPRRHLRGVLRPPAGACVRPLDEPAAAPGSRTRAGRPAFFVRCSRSKSR